MREQWIKIEGYENYSVSSEGRVRNDKSGRILRQSPNKCGYLQVRLFDDGRGCTVRVHRLVANAFIPNPYKLSDVNHINEDKNNNRVDNLEWMSHKDNCNFGTRSVRIQSKRNYDDQIRSCVVDGILYRSLREAVRVNNFNYGGFSSALWHGHRTYNGHSISYN